MNDSPTSAREGLQAMAAGDNGMLYSAWLDDRSLENGPRRREDLVEEHADLPLAGGAQCQDLRMLPSFCRD